MVTVSLLHACGGALRRAGAGGDSTCALVYSPSGRIPPKKARRARPASAVVAVCEFSHKSWSARWRRSCRQTAQDRCLPCPPRARPKRGWTGHGAARALVLPLPTAVPSLQGLTRGPPGPGPRVASPVCVFGRGAWSIWQVPSRVSSHAEAYPLHANVRLTGRHGGAVSNGSGDRRFGRFMELSLAARAMPWHSRVRGCLFFCGFVECGVRPPVQDLAYKPQHKRARLASRPRQRGGRGIGVWP